MRGRRDAARSCRAAGTRGTRWRSRCIAFKPDLFVPLEDYRRALAAEIAAIKATPLQEGVDEIRIPGERAYRDRARRTRKGIEIDRRIHDALSALAEERRRG